MLSKLKLHLTLWVAVMLQPMMAQIPLQDTLSALGLLGSHFGVPGLPASYDYVIIGGGTAGLTVARRLAANSSVTVAVIEAGGLYETDNGNLSQIPADAVYFIEGVPQVRNPLIDWYQFTEPQPVGHTLDSVQTNKCCATHMRLIAGLWRSFNSLPCWENPRWKQRAKFVMVPEVSAGLVETCE